MNDNSRTTTEELTEIRNLMERSSMCVSLSGLGGILVGVCALTGVVVGSLLPDLHENTAAFLTLASGVFLAALLCIVFFSYRRSRQMKTKLWNSPTKRMTLHLAIPFIAGSFIVLKLLQLDLFELLPATSLIVYGVAIFSASHYSTDESRWLSYGEMILGCVAICFPAFGWLLWAAGFGILHIMFGIIMWNRHEKKN
jgi:Na+/H+ antiporter NhaC